MTRALGSQVVGLEAKLAQHAGKHLLEVCRGDPDPDFIGAKLAFDLIAARYGIKTSCISTEPVAFQQNRMVLDWLGLEIPVYRPGTDLQGYDGYVVLDAHGVDRSLFKLLNGMPWVALMDHHEYQANGLNPEFKEVRSDVGSTCTILGAYLLHRKRLRVGNSDHRPVATALAMGIQIDTNEFHLAQPEDHRVMAGLLKYCDQEVLDRLTFQTLTEQDMDIIVAAWQKRESRNDFAIAGVQCIGPSNRVALARSADYMIRVGGINTSVVYAIIGDAVHGVVHTCNRSFRVKQFIERMFPTIRDMGGSYGGRKGAGGFKIPVSSFVQSEGNASSASIPEEWNVVSHLIQLRFYTSLGIQTPTS